MQEKAWEVPSMQLASSYQKLPLLVGNGVNSYEAGESLASVRRDE